MELSVTRGWLKPPYFFIITIIIIIIIIDNISAIFITVFSNFYGKNSLFLNLQIFFFFF